MKKRLLTSVLIALLCSFHYLAQATKVYVPKEQSSISHRAKYCISETPSTVDFKYNTCHDGSGSADGVSMTVRWYRNTTNSTSGGTLVSTTTTDCSTTGTGTVSYLPSTSAAGVTFYYCTITWSTGGCSCSRISSLTSPTAEVDVMVAPGTITGTTTMCTGVTTTTLHNSSDRGSWRSNNTSVASVDSVTGVVTRVHNGVAIITYTTGCGTDATASVNVTGTPSTISGSSSVCAGWTTTLTNSVSGGTWTSSNTGVATVDASTGIVTGVAAGTTVISYATGCGTPATKTVTVNPVASITGTTSVCQAATVTLSAGSGGTWSVQDSRIATISTSGTDAIVTGVSQGRTNITYSIGGCTSSVSVTVNPLPANPSISGHNWVCVNDHTDLDGSPSAGTWTILDTTLATINTSGEISGVRTGDVKVYYTVSNSCGSKTDSAVVTVRPLPHVGPISATVRAFCAGTTTTLTDTVAGGTWRSNNNAIATINSSGVVTGVGAGYVTLSYTVSNSCGNATATIRDTVLQIPTALSGTQYACPGSTTTFMDGRSGGVWSSSDTTIATVVQGAVGGTVTGITPGTATITYTMSRICPVVRSVTINPLPAAITGDLQVCIGSATALSSDTASGYWTTCNTNASIDSATGIVTGLLQGTSGIVYTVYSTGCKSTATVTVNPLPSTIYGTTTVACGGSTELGCGCPGGLWSTDNCSVATIDSVSGTVTAVASGTANITYTLPTGCATTMPVCVTGGRHSNSSPSATQQLNTSLGLYPNPTHGTFTILAPSNGIFYLYTIDGKEATHFVVAVGENIISLPASLAKGVYVGLLKGSNGANETIRISYE